MKTSMKLLLIATALAGALALMGATCQQGDSCCAAMGGQQTASKAQKPFLAKQAKDKQTATVLINGGYSPAVVVVQQGKPVELTFTGGKNIGCGGTVVFESLKISKDVATGKSVVVRFTPTKKGEIPFTCSMGMLSGKVIVK